jgi:hypothetical protein
MKRSLRRLLRAAACVVAVILCAPAVRAQQAYKVLSGNEILIKDISGIITGPVIEIDLSKAGLAPLASASITLAPGTAHWFDVKFDQPVFWISKPARSYILSYPVLAPDGTTAPGKPLSFKLTTDLAVTGDAVQGDYQRGYYLESNVALFVGDKYINDEHESCADTTGSNWQATVFREPTTPKGLPPRKLHARWLRHLVDIEDERKNPAAIGAIEVCLDQSLVWRQNKFQIDPAPPNAFLGSISVDSSMVDPTGSASVQLASSSAFSPPTAPATKDAAIFYANVLIAAGTGARGAWGLDGKIAMGNIPSLGGTLTLLSATANTGNNTSSISGQTYTDTIDWMLPQSWAIPIWSKSLPTLLTATISPKYETDYKFDKKNFLAAADTIWSLQKLYQPQSYRTKTVGGALPKFGDKNYAAFGYELEGHAGFEGGGALIDTTQQSSKKTLSITVPSYGIARVVPQIHGLWQQSVNRVGLFSFDSVITGRYLFQTENTVHELKDTTLLLVPVYGWKGINTLTTTWNPPMSNNVGLTVTYKTGFDAPKFARVNSVLIGVLIEF